jgi:hypothetical protein
MNERSTLMKYEIRAIANYRVLMISKYYIAALLGLVSLYLGYKRYNLSSLYILFILAVFPYAISVGLRDYSAKGGSRFLTRITSEKQFLLNNLKKKYKYTTINYISNSIAFPITLILIGLWHFRNGSAYGMNDWLRYVPSFILTTGLLLRLAGVIFYRLKLPHDLTHNRVG